MSHCRRCRWQTLTWDDNNNNKKKINEKKKTRTESEEIIIGKPVVPPNIHTWSAEPMSWVRQPGWLAVLVTIWTLKGLLSEAPAIWTVSRNFVLNGCTVFALFTFSFGPLKSPEIPERYVSKNFDPWTSDSAICLPFHCEWIPSVFRLSKPDPLNLFVSST